MPESFADASYTSYDIERGTIQEGGLALMPVAGPPPQRISVVRLHAGYELEYVMWSATKEGQAPQVPSPTMFDSNLLFLRGSVSRVIPIPIGFVSHAYLIAGVYWYVRLSPAGLAAALPMGKMPWETQYVSQNDLNQADVFSSQILSNAVVPPYIKTSPPILGPMLDPIAA